MGGKSSNTVQSQTIPPEILARYNAVNAGAENAAQTPFQNYSYNPNAFVAPLTGTQQAGVANTNYYANTAQPYYGAATGYLLNTQNQATPYYNNATSDVMQAQGIGNAYAGSSTNALQYGQQAASPYQTNAGQGYQQGYSGAQPYNSMASGLAMAGTQAVDPSQLSESAINQYMSPYLNTVLQGTQGMLNQSNQQAMAGQTGNAIRSGAFGGDRAGIAAANLSQGQQLANAKIYSDILNQGYGQALNTAQGQQQLGYSAAAANRAAQQQGATQMANLGQQIYGQGMGYGQAEQSLGQQLYGQGLSSAQQLAALGQQQYGQGMGASQQMAALGQGLYGMGSQTAQGLAGLGVGAQSAGLQGAQAQLGAGQMQQQTQQAGLQALYNQFLQAQSYPFQVQQFLANIAEGTGALSGSTTTTSQAPGGFSDKRLKENVKPIGKTFDGQNIYSYNFKGDHQTEIGLIAQEVEKHHPEAVGLSGGYRTVRYDKATEDAADRGHFAAGGVASMGGGVMPENMGQGFAWGGMPDSGYNPLATAQYNNSYQALIDYYSGKKGGLGALGYVPAATGTVGSLPGAPALPAPESALDQASRMVGLGTAIGKAGSKKGGIGLWGKAASAPATAPVSADTGDETQEPNEARGGGVGFAAGGLAGDGEVDDPNNPEIVVTGKPAPPPAPAPKTEIPDLPAPVKAPETPQAGAPPAAAPIAPIANIGKVTDDKIDTGPGALNIPQIGNKSNGPAAAAALAAKPKTDWGGILNGIANVGKTAMDMSMSDSRLKENIKAVGKTFDGQTVHSYNYKGDPQTRMGLIAQEVEKHHPEAVGKIGDYKAVDYKQATGLAAKRGHFAIGGGLNIPQVGNTHGLASPAGLAGNTGTDIGGILSGAADIFGALKGKTAGAAPVGAPTGDETQEPNEARGGGVGFAAGGLAGDSNHNPIYDYIMRQLHPSLPTRDDSAGPDQEDRWDLGGQEDDNADQPPPAPPANMFGQQPEKNGDIAVNTPLIAAALSAAKDINPSPTSPQRRGNVALDPSIVAYFQSKGAPDHIARAIAAGIQAESRSDPSIINPIGALGLGQWLGSRKKALVAAYGQNPSKQNQLDFMWHELNGGDPGGGHVLSAKDEPSALNAYITKFMRPAAGKETTGDISRGRAALGYAGGGLTGDPDPANLETRFDDEFGNIGATPDENDPRLNLPYKDDSPTGLAAATKPAPLPTADRDAANAIMEKAALSKAISPADNELLQRSAPNDAERGKFMQLMAKNGIGVENMPKPNQTGPYNLLSGQPGGLSPPPATAPTEKPAPKDRGVLGNILHGKFIGGLGQGDVNSWIPLLTGLGTFATTPSRGVMGGLLAGVGAGAQAAQAQRAFGVEQQLAGYRGQDAISHRIIANAGMLTSEMVNVDRLDGAIQSTLGIIQFARAHGGDTTQLNASVMALYNRRNSLVTTQTNSNAGSVPGTPVNSAPQLTKFPFANLPPSNPQDPNSVLTDADIGSMSGQNLPNTIFRQNLLLQGRTLDNSGKFGAVPSFAATAGEQAAATEAPSAQQADNRAFVTNIKQDYAQFKDSGPIVQAIPRSVAVQPTPDFIRNLQSQIAGIFGMSQKQSSEAFGNTYDAAALARMGNVLGVSIDPTDPVIATNALLNAVHQRFDNLGEKWNAVNRVEQYAKTHGRTIYDPGLDVRALVMQNVYGNKPD